MSIWGIVTIVVCVLLVVALLVALRGKEGRLARRQLRELRAAEGRTVDTAEMRAARKRGMAQHQLPGNSSNVGF